MTSLAPVLRLDRFARAHELGPLDEKLAATLRGAWRRWKRELHILFLPGAKAGHLAVWLGGKVAGEIERMWGEAPGDAYCLHRLAAHLCMEAAGHLVPEIAEAGCAPLPPLTPELGGRLRLENVSLNPEGMPVWAGYGVLTFYPYQGGCPVCELRSACPKRSAGPRAGQLAWPAGNGR